MSSMKMMISHLLDVEADVVRGRRALADHEGDVGAVRVLVVVPHARLLHLGRDGGQLVAATAVLHAPHHSVALLQGKYS